MKEIIESIDDLILIKDIDVMKPLMSDESLKNSVRLLCVFGLKATEVIFVTEEDSVYCYGRNRFGCLGLGVWDEDIPEPTLNETLSGKRLANIYFGFGHCIGLTRDGQCYGWAQNDFGQLGIGSFESSNTPKLIRGMPEVVDISCGNRHTIALTADGQVYAWGRNTFGQVGDNSWCWRWYPTRAVINECVVSISCGKCHSLALTARGQVYLWGLNEFGQLGRHRDEDVKEGKERPFCETPKLILGFENILFSKAVCGPNHTLLLTTDGIIYSFGINDKGQVGNGCFDTQYTPVKIKEDVKFKDIITTYFCDYSMAISEDNRYYNWGYVALGYDKITAPVDVTHFVTRRGFSIFDVYTNYSRIFETFKTLVIKSKNNFNENNVKAIDYHKNCQITSSEDSENSSTTDSDNCSPNEGSIPGRIFIEHLRHSFNNEDDYDFKFVFGYRYMNKIFCNNILEIRNKKFWQKIKRYLNEQNSDEIQITGHSYKAFYQFLKYLYGLAPTIDDTLCYELLELAEDYEEWDLKCMCSQIMQTHMNVDNVCHLFEISNTYELNDLKNSCIDFATNNWKTICKSERFQSMDEMLCKQLMHFCLK